MRITFGDAALNQIHLVPSSSFFIVVVLFVGACNACCPPTQKASPASNFAYWETWCVVGWEAGLLPCTGIQYTYTYLCTRCCCCCSGEILSSEAKNHTGGKEPPPTTAADFQEYPEAGRAIVWWRQACRDVCVCVGQVCSTKTHTHRRQLGSLGAGSRPRPFRTPGCGGTRLVDQHQAEIRAEL